MTFDPFWKQLVREIILTFDPPPPPFFPCRDNHHLRHEINKLKEKHIRQHKMLNKVSA